MKILRAFARDMRAAQTPAEKVLWTILRDRRFSGYKFRRQVPIGAYIADFVCFSERLIIEADGSQHGDSVSDTVRDAWLKSQGFRIRRFWNATILGEREVLRDTIWADLTGETTPSSVLRTASPARGEADSSGT